MGGCDGDTTLALLGSLVNCAILEELCEALLCLSLGDGGCEGCLCIVSFDALWGGSGARAALYLSVIDVANCTYIESA